MKPRRESSIACKLLRHDNFAEMSVNDYVTYKDKKSEFGLEHYFLPKNEKLEQYSLHSKIWKGKRNTYLDEAVAQKKFVPNKCYVVGLNLLDLKHKSNLGNSKRKLMGDDVKDF